MVRSWNVVKGDCVQSLKNQFYMNLGHSAFDFRILCLERIELYNIGDIFQRGDTMIKYLRLKKYYTRKLTIERTNVL